MQGEISCQIAQQQYALVVKSLKLIVIILSWCWSLCPIIIYNNCVYIEI